MNAEPDDSDEDIDLLDTLLEEFTKRCRAGEAPTVDEYAVRYPQHADRIRRLFEPVAMIEQLGALENRERAVSQSRAAFREQIPDQLGDFEIVEEIGRGGMGIVYEAIQKSLDRRVAVKLLARQTLINDKHLKRFQREARTAARLHHGNIVPVLGVGEQDGYHFYVMQFIEGVGLDEVLYQLRRIHSGGNGSKTADSDTRRELDRTTAVSNIINGLRGTETETTEDAESRRESPDSASNPTPITSSANSSPGSRYHRSVARIGKCVANALDYAHSQSVLHRDIKPANLLLGADGEVWVADFGLAKAFEHEDVSQTGDVVGTLRYMSPEQFVGGEDHRSDLFSLGLTLYEALTLTPARDDTSRSFAIQSEQNEIPSLRSIDQSISADLETIVLKACALEPESRYQSAAELADDLDRFLNDQPILARRATRIERFQRWCRRNPVVAALSCATALLLVLVTVATSVGYYRTNAALNREEEQRKLVEEEKQKAERILAISLEALERVYIRFAPDRLSSTTQLTVVGEDGTEVAMSSDPVLSRETAELLEGILQFYDRFAREDINNRQLRIEAAKATRRVGDIQHRLGDHTKAAESFQLAIQQYETLLGDSEDKSVETIEIARLNNALGRAHRSLYEDKKADASHLSALDLLEKLNASDLDDVDLNYEVAYCHYLMTRRIAPAPGGPPNRRRRRSGSPNGPRPEDDGPPSRPPGPEDGPPRRDRTGRRPGPPPDPDRPREAGPPPSDREFDRRPPEQHVRTAIDLLTGSENQSPARRRLLALCYRQRSRNGFPEDRQHAIRILRDLTSQYPDADQNRFELSLALSNDDVEHIRETGELSAAESCLREAREHGLILTNRHPNIPEYAHSLARITQDLSIVLVRLAETVDESDRPSLRSESSQLAKDAVESQARLVESFPQAASYRLWLAKFQETFAKSLQEEDKFDQAESVMEASLVGLGQVPRTTQTERFIDHAIRVHKRTLDGIRAMKKERK